MELNHEYYISCIIILNIIILYLQRNNERHQKAVPEHDNTELQPAKKTKRYYQQQSKM